MESIDNISKKALHLDISILDDKFKKIPKKNLTIDKDTYLSLKGDKIETNKKQSEISQNEMLFHVRLKKNSIFKLENPTPKGYLFQTEHEVEKLDNKLWCLLNSKNNKNNNYQNTFPIFENDIIKIGKMKYIVYEVHIISGNKDNDEINEDKENIFKNDYENVNKNTDEVFKRIPQIENKKCKFCET